MFDVRYKILLAIEQMYFHTSAQRSHVISTPTDDPDRKCYLRRCVLEYT